MDNTATLDGVGYTVRVGDLIWPLTISHRGGSGIYPENSWEAKTASVSSGFLPEFDLRTLADGRTLVSCHDATVDRTMTNISPGEVRSKTVIDWRRARVVPSIAGGHEGRPILWDEILDTWGGRVVLVPELKEPASVPTFLEGITRRGLQQSVIAQTFSWSAARQLAAAGLATMYLSSNFPKQTPTAIRDAGVAFVGGDLDRWSVGQVRAIQAAGLKALGFTVNTLAEATTPLARAFDGLFSNDAWATTESISGRSGDPFADGIRPYGMGLPYTVVDGRAVPMPSPPIRFVGRALGFTEPIPTVVFAAQPWAGQHLRPPLRVALTAHFGGDSTEADEASDGIGFVLHPTGTNAFPSVHPDEPALACLVDRNGGLAAWSYEAGAAKLIGSTTPRSLVPAPLRSEVAVELVVTISTDELTLSAVHPPDQAGAPLVLRHRTSARDRALSLRWSASAAPTLISQVRLAILR